ncbi:FHA domain-containing protein [Austwickia sp. TVS 96-490-7B]|uniref:FHA domain-containing protein n=1 Tax=Austwickia sp. TVS 96-490-7B TaxID=2830843 RepID=UPI001C57795C|nr:FHA domain-containing protein [Austwickia sp. TVS 96-490-7B]
MTMRFTSLGDIEAHSGMDRGLSNEDHATIEALRPSTALLLVLRGPNAGARFLLDAPLTTVGRHPDSDIFLDDVTVSRKHAIFEQEGDTFTVRDVGSLNGTYVNRERIERIALRTGDEVQIGKFRLIFYTAGRRGGATGSIDPSGL